METFNNLKIISCREGPILSDHSTVECTLSFQREALLRKTIKFRKIKDLDINRFTKELGESVKQSEDTNILAKNIERTVEKLLENMHQRESKLYHQE